MRMRDAAFLGILIVVFLACVVRDPRSDSLPFRSFHPLPDAIEYAVGAANIEAGRDLTLEINGHAIPSRYPFGFPLVIALFYRLLGNDIVNAYCVSIVFGAASIPALFMLVRALVPEAGVACWSAFFFATNSLVLSFAPLVMTELCSVFVALLALNLAVRVVPKRGTLGFVALGVVLGFGILVRTANVLMIPPIVLYLGWVHGRQLGARQGLAVLGPLAGAVGLLLLYNTRVFGSPFRDGYALYTPRTLFAWRFVAASALPYFRTLALAQGGKTLWLDGPFYSPLVPLLAVVGLATLRGARHRCVRGLAVTWIVLFYCFYASYFFYDFRFFLPVLPVVLLLAACGLGFVLQRLGTFPRAIVSVLVIGLYLLQPLSGGWSSLDAARHNRGTREPPLNYLYVQAVNAYMDRIGARPETHFVLSALNLVYHDHYSSKRYTILPLSRDQEYARVPELAPMIGGPDLDALLAQGREVYVSDFAADDEATRGAFRALVASYRLEPVPVPGITLARLSK